MFNINLFNVKKYEIFFHIQKTLILNSNYFLLNTIYYLLAIFFKVISFVFLVNLFTNNFDLIKYIDINLFYYNFIFFFLFIFFYLLSIFFDYLKSATIENFTNGEKINLTYSSIKSLSKYLINFYANFSFIILFYLYTLYLNSFLFLLSIFTFLVTCLLIQNFINYYYSVKKNNYFLLKKISLLSKKIFFTDFLVLISSLFNFLNIMIILYLILFFKLEFNYYLLIFILLMRYFISAFNKFITSIYYININKDKLLKFNQIQ
jgi:hypothetical protein